MGTGPSVSGASTSPLHHIGLAAGTPGTSVLDLRWPGLVRTRCLTGSGRAGVRAVSEDRRVGAGEDEAHVVVVHPADHVRRAAVGMRHLDDLAFPEAVVHTPAVMTSQSPTFARTVASSPLMATCLARRHCLPGP